MNHTNLAIVAVLAAAALVIGAFATTIAASPAFASSKTVTKQKINQDQDQSGFVNVGVQNAQNAICVLTGANCARQ
jgi:capsular polysaccharide biosynthesis protein